MCVSHLLKSQPLRTKCPWLFWKFGSGIWMLRLGPICTKSKCLSSKMERGQWVVSLVISLQQKKRKWPEIASHDCQYAWRKPVYWDISESLRPMRWWVPSSLIDCTLQEAISHLQDWAPSGVGGSEWACMDAVCTVDIILNLSDCRTSGRLVPWDCYSFTQSRLSWLAQTAQAAVGSEKVYGSKYLLRAYNPYVDPGRWAGQLFLWGYNKASVA